MNLMKKCKLFFVIAMVMVLISCIAICFVEIVAELSVNKGNNIPLYIVGSVFWIGLILAHILIGIAAILCNGFIKKNKYKKRYKYPGVICFFRNKEAMVADVLLVISILLMMMLIAFGVENSVLIIGSLCSTIFFVHLHGILNGCTYRFLRRYEQKNRYRKERRDEGC